MLERILIYLPYLGAAIVTNILLGTYHNVENLKEAFSVKKLVMGIIKAAIISEAFVATAWICDRISVDVDLGVLEIAPDVLIIAVVVLYLGKALSNLKDIFGVKDADTERVKEHIIPPYEKPHDDGMINHELIAQEIQGD